MQSWEQDFLPYTPMSSIGPGPAVVFAPHPEDEVFGCGGAIMRHVSSGDPVHVAIVTDGAYGPPADSEEYARTRQRESVQAAEILGYGVPEFWNLPDRGLEYGERLIQRILAAIEEYTAALVYTPSWWEIHPDRRVLALAVTEAVRRCGRPVRLAMYEVGVPLEPNGLLDITDLTERKAAAAACFASQLAQQNYAEQIAALNRFRTYTLPRTVQAAEGYLILSAQELRNGIPRIMTRKDRLAVRGETCDMATTPLVSVIIRCMDRAQLKEVLDSVALQTYPRIEVIAVNTKGDGDGHAPLAPWCGRFPLRFIPSDTPLPCSRAADFGREYANGAYIVFLDANHVLQPDHVTSLVKAFQDQSAACSDHAETQVTFFSAGHYSESALNGLSQAAKPWEPGHQLNTREDLDSAATRVNRLQTDHDVVPQSSSWAISAQLRFGADLVRGRYEKAWDSLRRGIRPAGRALYKTLPRHLADGLARTMYRHFGPIFVGINDYERWRREKGFAPEETSKHQPREDLTAIDGVPVPADPRPGRIAIHAHLSYSGLAAEMAKHLSRLPFPLDLFVTVESPADGDACRNALTELPQLGTLAISVVGDQSKAVQC